MGSTRKPFYQSLYLQVLRAVLVGVLIVNWVQPGAGMHVDPSSIDTKGIAAYTGPGKMQGTVDF